MNSKNPCRCKKKVDFLINEGVIDPERYRFAQHSRRSIELVRQIDDLERSAAIYRSTPQFSTPEEVLQKIKETINII
ncbi:MAG: hypothetical protein AAFN93_28140 [Bacteroidota bacterium]